MIFRKYLSSIILFLIVYTTVNAQNPIKLDDLDEFVLTEMEQNNVIGCAVAIVDKDSPVLIKGYGLKSSNGEKVQPATKFDIGSLTKSFTSIAILQLVDRDLIQLEDHVTDYLPDFTTKNPSYSSKIKIKHLLNHTSGFSTVQGNRMQTAGYDKPDALNVAVKDLENVELKYVVGEHAEYSNSNFLILGLIIERLTGRPYEDYIRKNIFDKIGMRDSSFDGQGDIALPYRYFLGIPLEYRLNNTRDQVSAGGIISSPDDVGKYLSAILRKDTLLLSSRQYEKIFQLAAAENNDVGTYGWQTASLNKNGQEMNFLWHSGSAPGYQSVMIIIPQYDLGFMVTTNTSGGIYDVKSSDKLIYGVLLNVFGLPQSPYEKMRIVFAIMWLLPIFFLIKIFMVLRNWTKKIKLKYLTILTVISIAICYICLIYLPHSLGGAGIKTVYIFAPEPGVLLISTSLSVVLWTLLEWLRRINLKPTNYKTLTQ